MAPPEFSLRLQKGITAGVAPSSVLTITQPLNSAELNIRSEVGSGLFGAVPKSLKSDDHAAMLDRLHDILKSIPNPGGEDIYGMDIGLAWGSEDLQWMNGSPQGCEVSTSTVQASDEDKVKFKEAVEIVEHLSSHAE